MPSSWCCGLNCTPPNSHVEVLIPKTSNATVFGVRAFKEGRLFSEVVRVVVDPAGLVTLLEERETPEMSTHREKAARGHS